MDDLEGMALSSYDRAIGLELSDVSVDGCITKSSRGGEKSGASPVDRGKLGVKRSTAVDGRDIPIEVLTAGANRHDSPLLAPTLDAAKDSIGLPRDARVHLDRAYDSEKTCRLLDERGLVGVINEKGRPAPLTAGLRWIVERTNSWHNAHKKLVWCTEREESVIDFWVAFSQRVSVNVTHIA